MKTSFISSGRIGTTNTTISKSARRGCRWFASNETDSSPPSTRERLSAHNFIPPEARARIRGVFVCAFFP